MSETLAITGKSVKLFKGHYTSACKALSQSACFSPLRHFAIICLSRSGFFKVLWRLREYNATNCRMFWAAAIRGAERESALDGILRIIVHPKGCDNFPHFQSQYFGLLSAHFPSNKRKGVRACEKIVASEGRSCSAGAGDRFAGSETERKLVINYLAVLHILGVKRCASSY
ncbi:MAG: hypothetical protein ACREYE_09245 [Gammaproteobacteria bacterium]